MRRQLGIRVSGFDAPRPVKTFQQCGFDGALMAAVRKAGYEAPTPIQAQGLPAALCGRDVLVQPLPPHSLRPTPPPERQAYCGALATRCCCRTCMRLLGREGGGGASHMGFETHSEQYAEIDERAKAATSTILCDSCALAACCRASP